MGEERSRSLESGCSEHNYETPKLLQKSPKASPPQVDRKKKPDSRRKGRNDQEDGYEPVGKAPLNMETWIAEKNNSSTQSWSPTPTRGTSTERPRRKAR